MSVCLSVCRSVRNHFTFFCFSRIVEGLLNNNDVYRVGWSGDVAPELISDTEDVIEIVQGLPPEQGWEKKCAYMQEPAVTERIRDRAKEIRCQEDEERRRFFSVSVCFHTCV